MTLVILFLKHGNESLLELLRLRIKESGQTFPKVPDPLPYVADSPLSNQWVF